MRKRAVRRTASLFSDVNPLGEEVSYVPGHLIRWRQFSQTHDCPTSDSLLAYAREALSNLKQQSISLHLAKCDFCSAELRLLSTHAPAEEVPHTAARVPLAVLLLAQQLLPKSDALKKSARRRAA